MDSFGTMPSQGPKGIGPDAENCFGSTKSLRCKALPRVFNKQLKETCRTARIPNMERSTLRRALWTALAFLTFIGCAVVIRRVVALTPVLLHGYHPSAAVANPIAARFGNLDDIF